MAVMNENELFSYINAGKRSRIYAVCSPDIYLNRRAVNRIVGSLPSPREIQRLDAKTLDIVALRDSFSKLAAFNNTFSVYLFNGDTLSELSADASEEFAELLSDIPEGSAAVIYGLADKRRPALPKDIEKLCKGAQNVVTAVIPTKEGTELLHEIELIAQENGATIERKAAEKLAELCLGELSLIEGEAVKAAAFSGYTAIKPEHIEKLTARTVDAGVFDIIKAAGAKDVRTAMRCLGEMLSNHEEPIAIAAALNANYINYYRALLLKKSGRKLADMYELYGYKKTDVKPKIAYERCGVYTLQQLEKIIDILFDFDSRVKSSRVDSGIQLEATLATILTT